MAKLQVRSWVWVGFVLACLAGCDVNPRNGVFSCVEDSDCPPEMFCHGSTLRCFDTPEVCQPIRDCSDPIFECGTMDDGCGTQLNCGVCESPDVCGGGGNPFSCGCEPTSCIDQEAECGFIPSGCGNTFINCGGTEACADKGENFQCNAQTNKCECAPTVQVDCANKCGALSNGCETVNCGECDEGFFCSDENVCTEEPCEPQITECPADMECGSVFDCGDEYRCGPNDGKCPEGEQCKDHKCECEPSTCAELGHECGQRDDTCGGLLDCGTCDGLESCGNWDSPTQFTCGGCSCEDLGYECSDGSVDICDEEVSCGVCQVDGERCEEFRCTCVDVIDAEERNDSIDNRTRIEDADKVDFNVTLVDDTTIDSASDADWFVIRHFRQTAYFNVEVKVAEDAPPLPVEIRTNCVFDRCENSGDGNSTVRNSSGWRVGCRSEAGDVQLWMNCAWTFPPELTIGVQSGALDTTGNMCRPYDLIIRGRP